MKQAKHHVGEAFRRFNESQLAKYNPKRTAYAYLGDAAHPYPLFDFTPGRS